MIGRWECSIPDHRSRVRTTRATRSRWIPAATATDLHQVPVRFQRWDERVAAEPWPGRHLVPEVRSLLLLSVRVRVRVQQIVQPGRVQQPQQMVGLRCLLQDDHSIHLELEVVHEVRLSPIWAQLAVEFAVAVVAVVAVQQAQVQVGQSVSGPVLGLALELRVHLRLKLCLVPKSNP